MQRVKKLVAAALMGALTVSAITPSTAEAAKKVSMSKTMKMKVYQTKTLKLKNNKKKVKWSVISGKACITLKRRKKTSVKVYAKKAGTAKVQAKIGKKKYYCKVTIKGFGSGSGSGSGSGYSAGSGNNNSKPSSPSNKPVTNKPTGNTNSNTNTVSAAQLAANCTVQLKKYKKGVRVIATNNNNVWVEMKVNYNIKNAAGTSIDTGTSSFVLEPKFTWLDPVPIMDSDLESVSIEKSVVTKTVEKLETFSDITGSVKATSQMTTDNELQVTYKNNYNGIAYVKALVCFYDDKKEIVDFDYPSTTLAPNETTTVITLPPYAFNDEDEHVPAYATYEIIYYAYHDYLF